ncbi:MAG: hypothetical protein K6G56_01735 [Clostridiales bacterium]|nr:hypothetical protein [Clostridiales bacterium]
MRKGLSASIVRAVCLMLAAAFIFTLAGCAGFNGCAGCADGKSGEVPGYAVKVTKAPTDEPEASAEPTDEPGGAPTESPTEIPTEAPSDDPAETEDGGGKKTPPTPDPAPSPTAEATPEPTEEPTPEPTPEPTATPTPEPTKTPKPTATPTPKPTKTPKPTATPTPKPTRTPKPTATPTPKPTRTPKPTATPTPKPTNTPKPTATPTPKPTNTPKPTATPTPTPKPTANPNLPYYLYYEKGSATLTIYEIGEDGYYSKVYKTYRTAYHPTKTPVGTFTLGGDSAREKWHAFGSHGFARFAVKYASGVYLHGPLYWTKDPNDLNVDYYDGDHYIGGPNSGGCLRMVVEAIRFIYENCPEGTKLKIVNGSPLGTTSPDVPPRNGLLHDPTDVDALPEP